MDPQVESLDLAELSAMLRRSFAGSAPQGYIRGRTALRDVVVEHLACSEAAAEDIIETMIGRGFLRFTGDPTLPGSEAAPWEIRDGS